MVFLRIAVQPARKKKITRSAKNSWISRCGAELVSRPSIELGCLDADRARLLAGSTAICDAVRVDEPVEVLVEVEAPARAPARTFGILVGTCATQSLAGTTIDPIANMAIIRKMMTHRPADGACEGMPRRSNHSSSGTSAIATTSAAVTGMKNSAPARSANGKRDDQRRCRRSESATRAADRAWR